MPGDASSQECGDVCAGLGEVESLNDRDLLVKMLERETILRRSPEAQIMFDQCSKEGDSVATAIHSLQLQVLREFGFTPPALYLRQYITTRARFPGDPLISEAALYIKYDRSCNGPLRVGSACPSPVVHHLDGVSHALTHFTKPYRPLVIVGGSYT